MFGTFNFHCLRCGVFEAFERNDATSSTCPKCGKASERTFAVCNNFHVPAWMSAQGSHASERQAAYLASDKHRQNRAEQERHQEAEYQRSERLKTNEEKLAQTINERVADNARYADQSPQAVSQRAKEYRASKFAT